MLGGFPPQFFAQMQAAAQENAVALVASAKLGSSKKNKAANSDMVVRSSVRKFQPNGGIYSVGLWARQVVENNLEWLIKIARRNNPKDTAVVLAYGDGCETLVLFDDQVDVMPKDFGSIKKIGVGVSVADADAKAEEAELAKSGVLQSSDPIWEHLKFQQNEKKEKALFIHTSNTIWSEGIEGRLHVIQVKTQGPSKPFEAISYAQNPAFEQQVLAKWKGITVSAPVVQVPPMLIPPPATAIAAAPVVADRKSVV